MRLSKNIPKTYTEESPRLQNNYQPIMSILMLCNQFSSVAEKLKMGLAVDPEEFAEVTIYFSGKFAYFSNSFPNVQQA